MADMKNKIRHLPLLLLLLLAANAASTLDVYLLRDDLTWVERSAADASRPWNAFGKPVFGEYYRPVANLMWLTSYYIFGTHFLGYQILFIALWLAAVGLVYAVSCRIGGRGAALIAAVLIGCNDVKKRSRRRGQVCS
jgi:4-amino-4-deoxy-L-arabinose transferase-like glycosyltransferase